ncbi:beta-ketoacyl-ACP synthase III [Streptococcus dentiloxodontae]
MAFAKISQAAHYVPAQVITNDDLSKIMDTSDEWISSRTGIRQRHISKTESTSDLATKVAEDLLEKSGLSAEELDFILVATISPDTNMPSTAARVQGNIGAVNAFAFDVTAACSGFVFALATAEKLISSGAYQKGFVIGAEVLSKTLDWTDRRTAVLFGDGAGGVLLETSTQQHFLAESLNTDGSKDGLESGATALQSPFSVREDVNPFLQMDGRSIFDFAIRTVSKSIQTLLADREEPDYFLLHQANIRILDKMARKIGVERDKFLANMMEYGNTSAASIPILLSESIANGTLKLDGSQTILLSGFGGGLTWGSLIVKI